MGKISQIYMRIYIEHCKMYDIDFCGSMFSHAQLSRWTKGSMTVHITVCTEIVNRCAIQCSLDAEQTAVKFGQDTSTSI